MSPLVLSGFALELEKISMHPETAAEIKNVLKTTGIITAGGAAGYTAAALGHRLADRAGWLDGFRKMPALQRQQTAAKAGLILGLGVTGATMAMRAAKAGTRRDDLLKLRQSGNAE